MEILFMHPMDRSAIYNARRKAMTSKQAKLLRSTKNSASSKSLEHDITLNDIVIPEFCPVFGFKLDGEGLSNNAPSVDRLDATKGYVKGNVRVISVKANRLKNNATLEELEALVEYVKREQSYGV